MLKKIFLPLSLAVFHMATGQNCTQELESVLPEGEHVFKEVHFKHKGKKDSRIFPENLSYVDHQGRIHGVVPDDMYNAVVRNEFNLKKKARATDMVIRESGMNYKVIFRGDVVEFIPEEENSSLTSFAINCNANMLILGNRKIELEKEKVAVAHPDNIFNSQWEGYSWKPAEESQGKVSSYSFTIARIRNSGKTYIEIKTPDNRHYRLLSG
ncbi:hypothetical protein [Sinomicrobium weinanense]|uniref:Uncharacterized protein n=1 Tax=Sinomicrobium weinanense TaxID=2842200 RepID=A0A926JTS4_9FLAO|nr:hypothetical protein [Sinomicrobium weinanense]MBC9797046.1 hypothetical protein [Sinomicrobium weinanense]MBU3122041.1 hypothetical protein [Sinomicrobium weinanense]